MLLAWFFRYLQESSLTKLLSFSHWWLKGYRRIFAHQNCAHYSRIIVCTYFTSLSAIGNHIFHYFYRFLSIDSPFYNAIFQQSQTLSSKIILHSICSSKDSWTNWANAEKRSYGYSSISRSHFYDLFPATLQWQSALSSIVSSHVWAVLTLLRV